MERDFAARIEFPPLQNSYFSTFYLVMKLCIFTRDESVNVHNSHHLSYVGFNPHI